MERMPCKKCLGKGHAKLENGMQVNCPACGGSGYQGIYRSSDQMFEEELTDNALYDTQKYKSQNDESIILTQEQKNIIINQIIKYPELFTIGKEFNYKDQNIQIFIYLRNQHMFNIKTKQNSMLITLKDERKNSLAEIVINKMKENIK